MGEEKRWSSQTYNVNIQSLSHVQIFATPWNAAHRASLSFTISWRLIKFMSIDLVMLSNYLILCHPLLLLPSIFPSINLSHSSFNESALHIKWPKYWSLSFSISPPMNTQGWFPLELTGLVSLLSRVFSSTTIPKHQFFGAQPSLWSNSHIHTWLLEKPYLWLYRLLSTKWCLCFLIHCLDLS